jgi:hypothetical protein
VGEKSMSDREREDTRALLLNQKYGWIKRIGDAVSWLRRRPRVVIAIELV